MEIEVGFEVATVLPFLPSISGEEINAVAGAFIEFSIGFEMETVFVVPRSSSDPTTALLLLSIGRIIIGNKPDTKTKSLWLKELGP